MWPRTDSFLRSTDAFSWDMERDPVLRSTIVAVAWLDRVPDGDRLERRLARVSGGVPHFRDVVAAPSLFAPPRWRPATDFDLSWHLRRQHLSAPGSRRQVLALAARMATTAFDPARPLWEVTVVTGTAHGGAAIIIKLHHALADGVGGMQVAALVFDLAADAEEPSLPAPPAEDTDVSRGFAGPFTAGTGAATRWVRRGAGATLAAVRHPIGTAAAIGGTAGSVLRTVQPVWSPLSPVMTRRHLGRCLMTLAVPLDALRSAAHRCDASLNDAFLTAVAGGLAAYHERHGHHLPQLRVTLPISIRGPHDPVGGNRITLLRSRLPAAGTDGRLDARLRMRQIGERVRGLRAEPSLGYTNLIAAGLNSLPPSYVGAMLKRIEVLASNVPGPPFPVYLAGARLQDTYAFGPTIGAALNVTLLSYDGTCHLGLNVDTAAAPDPEVLHACLREALAEVTALG